MYLCLDRVRVSSAHLYAVGYDDDTLILEIEFQDRTIWQYVNVPFLHYRGLLNACSKEHYFRAHIDGQFSPRRVR